MSLARERADWAACGAGALQRLVHDRLDRAGAATALRAATETAVNLAGGTRLRSVASGANGAVGKDVAGADDHETEMVRAGR